MEGPGRSRVPAWLPVWGWDPWLLLTWTELAEYLSSMHKSPVLKESKMKVSTDSQGPVLSLTHRLADVRVGMICV